MPHRRIREVVSGQHLVRATPTATVRDAARAMRASNVAALVIAEVDGHLDGIFTERDILHRVVADGRDIETTTVGDVMTPNPAFVGLDQTVRDAMQLMDCHGIRHLPVCEEDRVVGIVSMRDFVSREIAELEATHEVDEHMAKVMW